MPKLITILLLCFSVSLYGQEKKLEIELGELNPEQGPYTTYSFVNKEKDKACILLMAGNSIKGFVINSDYTIIKKFEAGRKPDMDWIVGGFFTEGKIHFLISGYEKDDNVSHYVYDLSAEMYTVTAADLGIKQSKFLRNMNLGNQVLILTVSKKEKNITVFTFNDKEGFEKTEFDYATLNPQLENLFPVTQPAVSPLASKGNTTAKPLPAVPALSKVESLSYFDDWEYPSAAKAASEVKIYYRNDTLIAVIDKLSDKIGIMKLGLNSKDITYQEIVRGQSLSKKYEGHSSSLLDNHLFSVISSPDTLRFSVFDFYSGTLLKEYKTFKEQDIAYRSTDITEEGRNIFSGKVSRQKSSQQLFRKMSRDFSVITMQSGGSLIMARKAGDGKVELTIGAYVIKDNKSLPIWSIALNSFLYSSFGPMPFINSQRDWIETARFKSILNLGDFEKSADSVQIPLDEKIDTYTKDIKIMKDCEGDYPVLDKQAYFYIDRKKSKLVISTL